MKEEHLSLDPRHEARRLALCVLFAWSFLSQEIAEAKEIAQEELELVNYDEALFEMLVLGVTQNIDTLDTEIKKGNLTAPFSNISKIDLICLRIGLLEIKITKSAPLSSAINEAVELAKEFGGDESFSFVNAVLGSLV